MTRTQVAVLGRHRQDVACEDAERGRLLGEDDDVRVRARHARLALVIRREAIELRYPRIGRKDPDPRRRA